MARPTEITIHEDRSEPGGGYAVIRITGINANPGNASYAIRRLGYDRNNLGYEGWQGPDARLDPLAVRYRQGELYLKVGPEVVDTVEVGTPVEIEVPAVGVRATLHWPEIATSVRDRRGPPRARTGFGGRGAGAPAAAPMAPPPAEAAEVTAPGFGASPADHTEETVLGSLSARPLTAGPGPANDGVAVLDRPAAAERTGPDFVDEFADFVPGDFLDDRWDQLGDRAPAATGQLAAAQAAPSRHRGSGILLWVTVPLLILLLAAGGVVFLVAQGQLDIPAIASLLGEDPEPDPVPDPSLDTATPPETLPPDEPTSVADVPPQPDPPPQDPDVGTAPPDTPGDGGSGAGWLENIFSRPSDDPAATEDPPVDPPATDPTGPDGPPSTDVASLPTTPNAPSLREPRTRPSDFVRSTLRDNPAPDRTYDLGQFYLDAGDPEVALLMFEHGAAQDHAPSLVAIGRMYDPVYFSPSRSAFTHANPERAAEQYGLAESLGDQNAAQALTNLRAWLEENAARGDVEAQRALDALQ